MNILSKRVQLLLDLTGLKQVQLAKIADVEPSYISMLLSGTNTNLGGKTARKISDALDVSYEWVKDGVGDAPVVVIMRPPVRKDLHQLPGEYGRRASDITIVDDETITQGDLQIRVWGNVGAGDRIDYNLQEVDPEKFKPSEMISVNGLFRHKIRDAFRVRGYSMFPVLRPGALIGVDFKFKKLIGSELYVFNFSHEGLSVKEVLPEGKRTKIHSYRPEIPDFYFEEGEIDENTVVGRVVWIYQDTT